MDYRMRKLEDRKNLKNTSEKITFGEPYNKFYSAIIKVNKYQNLSFYKMKNI